MTSTGLKIIRVLSGRSNVFLLTNGKSNILVDTGPGFMWGTLRRRLDGLSVEHIDLLFLTHSHFDHASNASRIKERYKAQVVIHLSESLYLSSGDNILPTGTNVITKFMVRNFAGQFESVARYQPCKPDITFEDTCDLRYSGFDAFIMHTPGHTSGSSSMIVDNEIALTGDTMFGVFPWTIFPPFASDQEQMLTSWEKLLGTGCRLFIPSHGSAIKRSLAEKDYRSRVVRTAGAK